MRLRRRGVLGLGLGGVGALALAGAHHVLARTPGSDELVDITVRATPIPTFAPREPEQRRFGSLSFRSGVVLSSDEPGFGGLSALWRSADGASLVAVSDKAQWLTGTVTYADGRLAGLGGVRMAPILGADGEPLRRGPAYDTESLAMADGVAYVGIERVHEVRRFAWARDGVQARGEPVAIPDEVKRIVPSNDSFEAVAVAPLAHPLAGSVIAIAENLRTGDDGPTRGWVLTGDRRFGFDVARSNGFDITDLAFLPTGEALLLERRFRVLTGVACRIRRISRDAFRPDAPLDGPTIFEAASGHEIDNMEGLAIHRDGAGGQLVVTLLSDNNFSLLQRTLLLEFALDA